MRNEAGPSSDLWPINLEIVPTQQCLGDVNNGSQVSSILNLDQKRMMPATASPAGQTMDIIILQNAKTSPNEAVELSCLNLATSAPINNFMLVNDQKNEPKVFAEPEETHQKPPSSIEDLLYFVCNLCPFLCTSDVKIASHLETAHLNKSSKKMKHLKCPACSNVFFHKISLRSHLIYDHSVTSVDIHKIVEAVLYFAETNGKEEKIRGKEGELEVDNAGALNLDCKKETIVGLAPVISTETQTADFANDNFSEDYPPDLEPLGNKANLVPALPKTPLPEIDLDTTKSEKAFKTMLKQNSVTKFIEEKDLRVCAVPSCKIRLHDEDKMNYHISSHNSTESGFKCLECSQGFSHWKPLTGHLWRSHKIDIELLSCGSCDYKTFTTGKLNIHKLIHSDIKAYICTICTKGFKNNKQLRNHKVIHREKSEKGQHVCGTCSRSFTEKRHLRLHMDVVHNKIKPFLCNFCGYKGSSRNSLKMHIRQHTGEKPFSCDECNYETGDHNSMRRHKLRHSGTKPYKCAYCAYECIQSTTYKVHLKTKHPNQERDFVFTCNECQFRTVNKDIFVQHSVTVHKEKPSG